MFSPVCWPADEALYGYVADGYWCDIGTLGEYHRANADLLNGRLNLGELGKRIGPDIWAGGTVDIAPDAQLIGPIYLGEEVKIKRGAIIQGPRWSAIIRSWTTGPGSAAASSGATATSAKAPRCMARL